MRTKASASSLSAATADDVAALCRLEASYYPHDGYPAPLFYQAIHQWPDLLQVVKVKSANQTSLAGYCLGAPGQNSQQLWLMSLLVDQSYRGMGLGKQLLQHWLNRVEQLGFSQLWLSVSPANTAAVKLYEQYGFALQTTETDYLGAGEDRYLMLRNVKSKH
ncbi:GNAT family N-acetyltransferase [Pseudidiomarina homiensis]|uniref:N-acetyltransferase domain-containing protein n=1 Tax=Pseudidiomarina homiensis TaxID=364198 RepID=A0A432Y3L6_9GAMM|nr:N-acetyltransferase [Pseudidiomarina homiensis]RUO55501.1 hypothetical protein CWI70_01565 [Pseudidiomarina homiensis]